METHNELRLVQLCWVTYLSHVLHWMKLVFSPESIYCAPTYCNPLCIDRMPLAIIVSSIWHSKKANHNFQNRRAKLTSHDFTNETNAKRESWVLMEMEHLRGKSLYRWADIGKSAMTKQYKSENLWFLAIIWRTLAVDQDGNAISQVPKSDLLKRKTQLSSLKLHGYSSSDIIAQ